MKEAVRKYNGATATLGWPLNSSVIRAGQGHCEVKSAGRRPAFRGASWHKANKKGLAYVLKDGKHTLLGCYRGISVLRANTEYP